MNNNTQNYDGFALKQAFQAAHDGLNNMVMSHQEVYTTDHKNEALAFINKEQLFSRFNENGFVPASEIKASIQAYYDSKPDKTLGDALTISLVRRWVNGYAEEIIEFDPPIDEAFTGQRFCIPGRHAA